MYHAHMKKICTFQFFFFFLVVVGVDLRTSHLVARHLSHSASPIHDKDWWK
jgi:hypothetical protein